MLKDGTELARIFAMGSQVKSAIIIFCVLIVGALAHATDRGHGNDDGFKIVPVSFTILNPDSHEVIGHAEYKSEHRDSS
jgi:hypothetical protein